MSPEECRQLLKSLSLSLNDEKDKKIKHKFRSFLRENAEAYFEVMEEILHKVDTQDQS